MAELKYGGSDVKIMYGSQEIGGATKLEPGTILYIEHTDRNIKDAHLLSTTKKWENINGINISIGKVLGVIYYTVDISGDDFKNLGIEKEYETGYGQITVSRSTVDGEYRLNVSVLSAKGYDYIVKAI